MPLATDLPPSITPEDTVRRPGESDRDVVERLYHTAIKDGPLKGITATTSVLGLPIQLTSGNLNNMFAGLSSIPHITAPVLPAQYQEALWSDACGGYQGQVLNLFNQLRQNPLTSAYFTSLDYGPVQAEGAAITRWCYSTMAATLRRPVMCSIPGPIKPRKCFHTVAGTPDSRDRGA